MRKNLLFLFLFSSLMGFAQNNFTISGYVKSPEGGEEIIGATITIRETGTFLTTNDFGFFSITLPKGEYTLIFSMSDFENIEKKVSLTQDTKLDIELPRKALKTDEIKITLKRKDDNIKKVDMSTIQLDIKAIQKMPAFLGEADVIKSIQTLPGVSTIGEGASGFNVRGGNIDQNLILLDDAPVFNSSHLLGFFSVFNPDAVKSVKLVKGGISSQYGGRLSSLLDVRMKDGNKKKFQVNGGVGIIFSRLSVEGPIIKNKASFIVAARRSYFDVLFFPFFPLLKDAKFNFYDLTAKVNWEINKKNKIYLSGYLGGDVFGLSSAFGFKWGNTTTSLRWNHLFNEKMFMNMTTYFSKYDYNLDFGDDKDGFHWKSSIINYAIKPEITYYPNSKNTLKFGLQSTLYRMMPGSTSFSSGGVSSSFSLDDKYALESGIYLENEQKIGSRLILVYGLRFSGYQFIGPGKSYNYGDTTAGEVQPLLGTTDHKKGEIINSYYNPEPRFSLKYDMDEKSSVKASYNRMAQYIHLLSNTAASTPLDMWSLSTNNIKPQIADQLAVGYFRNIGEKQVIETSAEIYYKWMQNQLDYIKNAALLLNETYEGELLGGLGRSYGLELYAKKSEGRLTGWLSYTLSRSEKKVESINQFKWYPTRFDKTHNMSLVLNYKITKRIEASANFVYSTGLPSTFPNSKYVVQTYTVSNTENDARNNFRITPYHRLDLSITIKPKEKENRKFYGEWVLGVYNVYARKNAFTIYFRPDPDDATKTQAVRYTIVGAAIPSLSYNFNF